MMPSESEPTEYKLSSTPPSPNKLTIVRVISFLTVVALSAYIFSIRERAADYAIYGYPGVFLISFMAYATVLLPAPGAAFVFTMGAVLDPLGIGIAAGAGAALGEISGYMVGFSGQAVIERAKIYERLSKWMQKNGPLTVFLLSAIPNPFFDLAGAIAGASRMPVMKFLIWCWIGETIKMLLFAYSGAYSLGIIK